MLNAGKYQEMVDYCKSLIDKDPKDLMGLQNMSTALIHLGDFEHAIEYCDIVLGMDESDEHSIKNKIFALEQLHRFQELIPLCDKMLTKNSDTWILTSKGLALNELDKHNEALECYDQTLELEKNNLTALLNKANTLSYLEKYDDAILFFDKAQQLDPSIKEISTTKSKLFTQLGKEDEAFLSAQGVLLDDMEKIKEQAKKNKCTIFHQFCLNEFEETQAKKNQNK